MKIVFLDIDGVLVTRRSLEIKTRSPWWHLFDPPCVAALNTITATTGAVLVVSSTWRLHADWCGLVKFIADQGVIAEVIGATPRLLAKRDGVFCSELRGIEIQAWLCEYEHPVESFIILDDDSDMAHLYARLVKTNLDGGLRAEHVKQAVALLGERLI